MKKGQRDKGTKGQRAHKTSRPFLACAAALVACFCLSACDTQRRIMITSEPTDAQVILNDVDVGRTPLEVDFTYFGVYDVRVKKQGYEPLATKAKARAPMYEWPGIDLFTIAIPGKKETIIKWHFTLEPAKDDTQGVIERATELRTSLGQESPAAEETPK